jgi:hypothetical protein
MPPKVLALPRNGIEPRVSITGISAQDIHALLRDGEWCTLESRNQKVVLLSDFAMGEYSVSIPAAFIGRVFGVYDARVWIIRSKAQKAARPSYRPFALSSEQDSVTIAFVERRYNDENFVTPRDPLNFVGL